MHLSDLVKIAMLYQLFNVLPNNLIAQVKTIDACRHFVELGEFGYAMPHSHLYWSIIQKHDVLSIVNWCRGNVMREPKIDPFAWLIFHQVSAKPLQRAPQ